MQITPLAPTHPRSIDAPPAPTAPPTAPVPTTPLPPIVDLTDVQSGDVFDLMDGSTAGRFGAIKGVANITSWTPDHAAFHIQAKKMFFTVDVDVDIQQIDATHVILTSRGSGIPDSTIHAHVVESRRDYASFVNDDDPAQITTISQDSPGHAMVDADVPGVGRTHLVLQRRARR